METTSQINKTFRGWTIPGPVPPGARGEGPELEPGETLDAISGHYKIFQLRRGHRFSTDDVLTAWYGTAWCPRAEDILDLGSGIGSVGMIAAWRLPRSRIVAVEAQEESAQLAKKSAHWNGLDDRVEIRCGDFRDKSVLLKDELFDLVLGSPPYFPLGSGVLGDHPQKVACRFEVRGSIVDYCSTAASHLRAGGLFACVFPVFPGEQQERVKAGASGAGLAIVRSRPIALREGERPLLSLFAMMRGSDLPDGIDHTCWTEPVLSIRDRQGAVHPDYAAVKLAFGFPP